MSTIITPAVAEAIRTWVRVFSMAHAHRDPSLFDYAAVGTDAWQDFWGDLFNRSYAGARNPLHAAWYATLCRSASAADLEALEAAFGSAADGMTCLRFLQYNLLREARTADRAGLEVSAAIPVWFRSKGWGVGAPWRCEEEPQPLLPAPGWDEPVRDAAAVRAELDRARRNYKSALRSNSRMPGYDRMCSNLETEIADLEHELADLETAPGPLEPAPQDAAGNWRGRIEEAERRYRALVAAGASAAEVEAARQHYADHFPPGEAPAVAEAPAPPADPQLQLLQQEIADLDALKDHEWASSASSILHRVLTRSNYAASHPAYRAAVEAFLLTARANVYFRHCFLSVAEDVQWMLDGLIRDADYVA